MRVSLIRPRTGNTPDPPLGLLSLAACAKAQGHTVQVLDPGPGDNTFLASILAFNPDVVGYSLLTTQVARGLDIHRRIKAVLPHVITTAGGIHPTALPRWTLSRFELDFVVVGEGEITFPEALAVLETGSSPADVPGVATLKDGVFQMGPVRPPIPDLDVLPYPDRDVVDFSRYLRPPGNIRGTFLRRGTSIISSRGCPFGCIFCSSHELFGRAVRRRSVNHIMGEIEHLVRYHRIDGLWFLDDTLLEDISWLEELCRGLKSTGLPWACQAHVRRADETVFGMMKASGCLQIEFGVESGSRRILRRLRKGSTPDDVLYAFSICRKLGIRTLANFMIGIPDETEEDISASLALARRIRPDHVVVTFATPLPGSDLYREASDRGWISKTPDFSDRWIIRQTEDPAVVMTLDGPTLKRIRKAFDNAFFWTNIKDYFRYPRFVLDILRHLLLHPARYRSGFTRFFRTGRLGHLVESIWEEYNRV